MERLPATLLVLAGGESRRMGYPKALLRVGGTTMLSRVLAELAPAFDQVLVSAHRAEDLPARASGGRAGVQVVTDLHPGAGPLAGLEAGIAASRHETVFAAACDMPFVTRGVARLVVMAAAGRQAAVPRPGGRAQPACAAYHRSVAPVVARALERGMLRFTGILDELDVRFLEDDELSRAGVGEETFWSVNTPADLARLVRLISGPPSRPGESSHN